jgi:plastocyanin
VAVDDKGKVYVTWYDGTKDSVMLASGDGTTFTPVQTQDTQGGAYPSVAVTPDGSKVYVSWYGEQGQDLRLGVEGGDAGALAVAVPSPTPSVAAGGGPSTCGTNKTIALNETAQGTAFLDKCLVAPAGKDFSIVFDDKDDAAVIGQHNIAIYSDAAGTKLVFQGQLVTGPAKVTYDVTAKSGPLAPGTYYFHCQVHPVMTGELAVVK